MNSKITRNLVKFGAGATLVALKAPLAMAQVPIPNDLPSSVPGKFSDIGEVVNTIFQVVIAAAGVIFILMFLYGGIAYLTAAGNEEATGKARRLLVDSIVGLIIVLAAWAIGTWVLGAVGLTSDTSTLDQF